MSIEEQISSIEKKYEDALENLYELTTTKSLEDLDLEDITGTLKIIIAFQRELELLCEDIRKLADDKTKFYVQRCWANLNTIRRVLGEEVYDLSEIPELEGVGSIVTRKRAVSEPPEDGVYGLIDAGMITPEHFKTAFNLFTSVTSCTYEIFGDVRLIYALRIFPMEARAAIKSRLSDLNFIDVVKCLDQAEQNIVDKHHKDCHDRCREALEKTASSILEKEGKKASHYFSTDIGTLSGMGVVEKETKRLIEATHAYLSQVGSHGISEKEPSLGDANFALKDTYLKIDTLLNKYDQYLARK